MIDREQLKCMPELMAVIEQEHSLEEVESVSFTQGVGSYADKGMMHTYPLPTVHVTVVFTDGTAKEIDGPISYVMPKKEEEEQEAENEQSE